VYNFFVPEEKMSSIHCLDRLEVDGKFFRAGGERVFLKVVTYGPFPDPQPNHAEEMKRIAGAGFNALRVYGEPEIEMLDAAAEAGLWVMVGPSWSWSFDFIGNPKWLEDGKRVLTEELERWGKHPAVAAVYVANEIPVDLVRWMGVVQVRRAIEEMISFGRQLAPHLLFAYSNFPTTEFLEPDNADFTAMNVYLECREDFARYLPRLHHVAGDRPVLISEFGLDSQSCSEISQRETLCWMVEECLQGAMAGTTVYAWSDRWQNGGRVMSEWAFGLVDSEGQEKPAFYPLSQRLLQIQTPEDAIQLERWPMFSVVVCVYNGGERMPSCLEALEKLDYPNYEVIVVDDGSTDHTAERVSAFSDVRYIRLDHVGLSAARNRGMEEAKGEIVAYTDDDCQPDAGWLKWLAWSFERSGWDACGGPNLPPLPERGDWVGSGSLDDEAVVASAPGAPSHVMLNDLEAEHLPGCNLVVKKEVLKAIGGFNPKYRVAGDDVDLCWRLDAAGYRMGFSGGAFVWHRRRTSLWRYFKQQKGYGKAEALLMQDHPEKFSGGGGAQWKGQVYVGGAMCADEGSVIYHGPMGMAAYQQISLSMQPRRPLPLDYQRPVVKWKLALAEWVQPRVRFWARQWYSRGWQLETRRKQSSQKYFKLGDNWTLHRHIKTQKIEVRWRSSQKLGRVNVLVGLLRAGWRSVTDEDAGQAEWDVERDGVRLLLAQEFYGDYSEVLTRVETRGRTENYPESLEDVMLGLGFHRCD